MKIQIVNLLMLKIMMINLQIKLLKFELMGKIFKIKLKIKFKRDFIEEIIG
jgi:hypothetical protein